MRYCVVSVVQICNEVRCTVVEDRRSWNFYTPLVWGMIYHFPPLPPRPPSLGFTTKLTEVNLFQLIKFMVTRRCTPRSEDTAWITWYVQGHWHFYSCLRNLQEWWCSINFRTWNKAALARCICTLINHDHLHTLCN